MYKLMTDMDLTQSASELVQQIKNKDISAVELLEKHLDRIGAVNPDINAVVTLDEERALERAAAADEALEKGADWGPLHGLPMTVKDAYEVEGIVTTGGSPKWKDHVPQRHAEVVERLTAAGAIVFGKTNVPYLSGDWQTYNEIFGITNNPWDHTKTPGGSSGGSAAAVAAGLTPLEVGSDIGGSVRIPAHFCGVYGHKPSYDLIPIRGHLPP
ncbi:MAG: amidase family protein, partial [Candidatus Neomarinimicrobiota bacterium]|nr:amidase family protein [Candidatus Neomarinimicrobiota bacterium]